MNLLPLKAWPSQPRQTRARGGSSAWGGTGARGLGHRTATGIKPIPNSNRYRGRGGSGGSAPGLALLSRAAVATPDGQRHHRGGDQQTGTGSVGFRGVGPPGQHGGRSHGEVGRRPTSTLRRSAKQPSPPRTATGIKPIPNSKPVAEAWGFRGVGPSGQHGGRSHGEVGRRPTS